MRFLVTAGNTREMIDSVRQWSNIFTGNTGLSIAKALMKLGPVDLFTSNPMHLEELKSSEHIQAIGFSSHAHLRQLLEQTMQQQSYDAIVMSAAVSDYQPTRVFAVVGREQDPSHPGQERWIVQDAHAGKIKSNHPAIAVLGEPTEKLVDLFRSVWNFKGILVKFKLEVGIGPEELIRIGQASRASSGADYLLANTLDMIQGEHAGAYLLSAGGEEWVPRNQLAARMVKLILEHA